MMLKFSDLHIWNNFTGGSMTTPLHQKFLSYLSEMLLSFQKLLLASGRVWKKLIPAFYQGSMASFDGLWLDVFGSQQLILQSCDVGDALLLEGLETSIKRLLQTEEKQRQEFNNTMLSKTKNTFILSGRLTCLVSRVWTEDRSLP